MGRIISSIENWNVHCVVSQKKSGKWQLRITNTVLTLPYYNLGASFLLCTLQIFVGQPGNQTNSYNIVSTGKGIPKSKPLTYNRNIWST